MTAAVPARAPSPPLSADLEDAVRASIERLCGRQEEDGSWPGNYGGPLFLLPLYIATCHMIGEDLDDSEIRKMRRYIRTQQNADGGWGLHEEGASVIYGTTVNYVALRLLGTGAGEPEMVQARDFLKARGGAVGSASWGKFFLALLDLYPYEHLNPLPPELWLLPESVPLHPSRLWCHCRMVYLPMSYLYGRRAIAGVKTDADVTLRDELRREIYCEDYDRIDWEKARKTVAKEDNVAPQTALSRATHVVLKKLEKRVPQAMRQKAMNFVLHQIDREDKNTNYICIGPINKLLNTLVWFHEDPSGPELTEHRRRLRDYLYEDHDTILMQGYNSSRLWDTTFAVQALIAASAPPMSSETEQVSSTLQSAHQFIAANQIREDVCDRLSAFRHASKGGWPFSDQPHGWPISDCTAEGLKSALLLQNQVRDPLPSSRLSDAVELILSLQNPDGGWATYEPTRGPAWLEKFNPSDCFRDIMIDYSYVECTSACIQALRAFLDQGPPFDHERLEAALSKGRDFLLSAQRADGSFEGSWGVCFTYGTWFGVAGLRACGLSEEHPAVQNARRFVLSKQRPDGGWGESVKNCETRSYDMTTESQAVMTSWALLTLLRCGTAQDQAIERGVSFLLERRRPNGSYPAENIPGVFNKTCAIHYDNYLDIFPLWALAEFMRAGGEIGEASGRGRHS